MSEKGKTVFDHLSEQIDQVVRGRRYIIAEIGKLKVSLDEFKEAIDKSSGGSNLGSLVNDMKSFMQTTVTTLTDLKGTISQLSGVVNSLQTQVQQLNNQVQAIKSSGGVRASAPAASPAPASFGGAPSAAPSSFGGAPAAAPASFGGAPAAAPASFGGAPAAAPASFGGAPAAAPAAAPAGGSAAASGAFDSLMQAANAGKGAKDLGDMIDLIRTNLAKANPLNPILFELTIEAGRLKSMGSKPLDPPGITQLQQKVDKWKSKS